MVVKKAYALDGDSSGEEAVIVALLVETITAIRATLEAVIVEIKVVIVVVALLHSRHVLSNPVIELIL